MNTGQKTNVETSSGACVYKIENGEAFIILINPYITNTWGIPKGHVDEGESITDAAHREVYEESGVKINLEEKLDVVYTKIKRGRKYVHSWLAVQACESRPESHDPDKEVALVSWHNINNLPKLHKYQISLIEQAVSLIREKMAI